MGRITKAHAHMSEEQLRASIKQANDARTAQKSLVIWDAMVDPRPAAEITLHLGVSVHSVHHWIPA